MTVHLPGEEAKPNLTISIETLKAHVTGAPRTKG